MMTGESALAATSRLAPTALEKATLKADLLELCDQWLSANRLSGRSGLEAFVVAYPLLNVPSALKTAFPAVKVTTLYNWRKEAKKGIAALAPQHRGRAAKVDQDEKLKETLLGLLASRPHIRPRHAWEILDALPGGSLVEGISVRTIDRAIERLRRNDPQMWLLATNPDAWKSKYQPAPGRADGNVERLNQLWELDSTPADILLLDEDGRTIRCSIIGAIDVYSRRLKFIVSRTSRAESVCALLRRALLDWGVPETILTDNGADYTSHHVRAVVHDLEIVQRFTPPYQGDKKPHIERAFGTFSRDLLELSEGYAGHDVTERQALEAVRSFAQRLGERGALIEAKLTPADLQSLCDRWCEFRYAHRLHSRLGCSPFMKAQSWTEPVRRIANERDLDLLLVKSEVRVVQKDGIRLGNYTYWADECVALIGSRVVVKPIPGNLGRIVVMDEHREQVFVAEQAKLEGIDERELAGRAQETKKSLVAEQRKTLKSAKKTFDAAVEDKVLRELLLERDEREARKVTALKPAAYETFETPALVAAAEAVRVNDALEVTPIPASSPAPIPLRPQLAVVRDEDEELNERAWREYLELEALGSERTPQQARRMNQLRGLPFIQGRLNTRRTG